MSGILCDTEAPSFLIYSSEIPKLLYYSHIPTALVALFFGIFVLLKNPKALLNRLLFFVSFFYLAWSFFDLILWTHNDSGLIIFLWSLMVLIEVLIFLSCLYLMYTFIDKDKISLRVKIIWGLFILPVIFLLPTRYIISEVYLKSCDCLEGFIAVYYVYILELTVVFWIIIFSIVKYRKVETSSKRQIILLTTGLCLFLFSFSWGNIVGSFTDDWNLAQYGLFGMPIFVGFLAYLIVRYKAFNIKLMAVQALAFSISILIGSQYFFIRNFTNRILTGITLVIASFGGYLLVRSVKKEVGKSEELALLNEENNKRKEQLQKISDALAISNDRLKQLDSAKTEFISMASHQLRTPVTGIKGYLSMLLEGSYGELSAEQKVAMSKTYESNERMVTLIEDLLNVSKIESGRLEYTFANTKIETICQEIVNTLYPKAKNHNLYLDYKKPTSELPELWIDGIKVREVVSNLVDNAIKYTLRGGVNLTLEFCEKNELNCLKKPHIRIVISDTGIGIPDEEIPYLFQKFSRGKDIGRLNASGTGLGLFVGKKMIEGNGGKIWIESAGRNKGSKFIVELPVGKDKTVENIS